MTNRIQRWIPSIEQLAILAKTNSENEPIAHDAVITLLRIAVGEFRQTAANGALMLPVTSETEVQSWIMDRFALKKQVLLEQSLKKTINATGVVLHTNLGRAPLSDRARAQVTAVMEGYSTLEYDLQSGRRGERYSHVEKRLTELTRAEAALIVNNNAAAVMLVLAGIARGREVIVSRGELVEIGGSFRIPDVIRQSGATLVEVGTTNKTHLQDYAAAITPATAAILKVHTSNFAIVGFTSHPGPKELCCLAKQHQLVSINDVGSGTLLPLTIQGTTEPTVQECIDSGFDLVTFSGDKLLGAGQAGLIVGSQCAAIGQHARGDQHHGRLSGQHAQGSRPAALPPRFARLGAAGWRGVGDALREQVGQLKPDGAQHVQHFAARKAFHQGATVAAFGQ